MTLCPVCEQPLPETPISSCPNCGADVAAVPPAAELPPPQVAPFEPPEGWTTQPREHAAGTPWDERGRIGFLSALVETTRQVLTGPSAFFRAMPVEGGIGSPLLFGVIVGWLGAVAAGFYQALFHSIVGVSLFEALARLANPGASPSGSELSGFLEGWGGFAGELVFGGVFVAIGVMVNAGVLHLALLLLGGAQRGFEATVRVVCFSQAVSILFLVPFCGQLAGAIWALALYVVGLSAAHRIGLGKATGAVLLPLVFLCCCCGLVLGLVFVGAAGLATQLR
jgi:hypothetical protein